MTNRIGILFLKNALVHVKSGISVFPQVSQVCRYLILAKSIRRKHLLNVVIFVEFVILYVVQDKRICTWALSFKVLNVLCEIIRRASFINVNVSLKIYCVALSTCVLSFQSENFRTFLEFIYFPPWLQFSKAENKWVFPSNFYKSLQIVASDL